MRQSGTPTNCQSRLLPPIHLFSCVGVSHVCRSVTSSSTLSHLMFPVHLGIHCYYHLPHHSLLSLQGQHASVVTSEVEEKTYQIYKVLTIMSASQWGMPPAPLPPWSVLKSSSSTHQPWFLQFSIFWHIPMRARLPGQKKLKKLYTLYSFILQPTLENLLRIFFPSDLETPSGLCS